MQEKRRKVTNIFTAYHTIHFIFKKKKNKIKIIL